MSNQALISRKKKAKIAEIRAKVLQLSISSIDTSDPELMRNRRNHIQELLNEEAKIWYQEGFSRGHVETVRAKLAYGVFPNSISRITQLEMPASSVWSWCKVTLKSRVPQPLIDKLNRSSH